MESAASSRRWLAPEIVQTSPMDCGPAALKCLLEGFGVDAAYGRLREACQTDVDGTSIDVIESVARELGLDATQILVPVDHLASSRAATLPALVVVRLSSGANHFVVAWRRVGSRVQIMDPASGRRWIGVHALRRQAYEHGVDMTAETWRRFATSKSGLDVLALTLRASGHAAPRKLIERALEDRTWRSIAALEAAARMTRSLVEAGGVRHGAGAARLLESLFETARTEDPARMRAIPPAYWNVRPHAPRTAGEGAQELLHVRGALLVRVRGKLADRIDGQGAHGFGETRDRGPLSPELRAALLEKPARAAHAMLDALRADGRLRPGALGLLVVSAAAVVLGQALLFRALFDLGARLALDEQRLVAAAMLLVFVGASVALELPLAAGFLRLGRHLEARLRIAFQEKIPRLSERYFSSRPSSDMAERAHSLVLLREMPTIAARCARTLLQLAFTAAGLVWLDPASAPIVIVGALFAAVVPFLFQRTLSERELALRSHHGALTRYYLDALLGLVAVRVHGAEAGLRREHESLLVEWVRAGRRLLRSAVWVRFAGALVSATLAALLVIEHAARGEGGAGTLLYGYWALGLPALGEQLAQVVLQLPAMRNATLRALEPLGAGEDPLQGRGDAGAQSGDVESLRGERPTPVLATQLKAAGVPRSSAHRAIALSAVAPIASDPTDSKRASRAGARAGVAIEMRGVALTIGGHAILSDIDLAIRPGEHVALVGRSGAGKSSLIGLVLGWQPPSSGRLAVDHRALDALALSELRRATVWIDPAAQLWNRSLFENLIYGNGAIATGDLVRALTDAELEGVFASLPAGLETPLGEGGAFLSGGEGQRVRFARALLRDGVRLALLDEPFRGLDRARRAELLARARRRWRSATLVCATHDLEETLAFDRVVVVEDGRIVEDGPPGPLAARAGSRFGGLLAAERALRDEVWSDPSWTRWHVEGGHVRVESRAEETP